MSALENKLEKGGFMEERFRERLRTSGKIENSLSTIAYFREKILVNRTGIRNGGYITGFLLLKC